ncbi:MAG: hypothetical protein Alpg2KO_17430 [Alphaproteobacteria bacterium]
MAGEIDKTDDNQPPAALSRDAAKALSSRFRARMHADIDKVMSSVLTQDQQDIPGLRSALFHYAYFRRHARRPANQQHLTETLQSVMDTAGSDPVHRLKELALSQPRAFPWSETRGHIKQAGGTHGTRHDHMFEQGEWRRYYPLPGVSPDELGPRAQLVIAYLETEGFHDIDYINGTCLDERNQTRRIGRLLPERMKEKFANDPDRQGGNLMVVISRHPWDHIRMSTQRGWESCLARDGMFKEYLPREVKAGAMVAYLVSRNDPEILDPLARVGIKPYTNSKGEQLMIAADIYGMGPDRFKKTVQGVLDQEYNAKRFGDFALDDDQIYDDGLPYQMTRMPQGYESWSAEDWIDYLDLEVTEQDGKRILTGDLRLRGLGLTELPDFSAYHLHGSMDIEENRLTSLKGCPIEVTGEFKAAVNHLTTLSGAPRHVGSGFYAGRNRLTTTAGMPANVGGVVDLRNNQLEKLEDMPPSIPATLMLSNNLLTSLEGFPAHVKGFCHLEHNGLLTLEGDLETVEGGFSISNNPSLLDLQGMPRVMGDDFRARQCGLTSLDGMDPEFSGTVNVTANKLTSLEGLPDRLKGGLIARHNRITTLKHLPKQMQGALDLSDNCLTTTRYLNRCSGYGTLSLSDNQISVLEDMPESHDYRIRLSNNRLTSVKGLPKRINSLLELSGNQISDATDLPEEVGGRITLVDNPLRHLPRRMPEYCRIIVTDKGSVRNLPSREFPPAPNPSCPSP